MSKKYNSKKSPSGSRFISSCKKEVGNLLFLSGVGPRKAGQIEIPGVELNDNGEILNYDIATQCHSRI